MAIRFAVPDDVARLKEIITATELFPAHLLNDMIAPYFAGENENWLVFETEDSENIVGLAYYMPEPMTEGTYNALLLAVHPGQQGRGVGAALMIHIEQTLREQNKRILLVETSGLPEFERTRRFYRKIGYEEEARIRDFYASGEDKIVFYKALGSSPR